MTTSLQTRVSLAGIAESGANFAEETARITSAGGFVEFGRVNGTSIASICDLY